MGKRSKIATHIQVGDHDISLRIEILQRAIKAWATARDLWYDTTFKSYAEHVDGEPSSLPVATILCSDGDLIRFITEDIEGSEESFRNTLDMHGFWYENSDGVSLYIYPEEGGPLHKPLFEYVRWQWICGLIRPDIDDVYEDIYSHFVNNPEDLHRIGWRELEVLIARSLRHQGFQVELGPGSNDGGVDIRLLQRDPLGDLLTLVQVKRYAPHRKIDALAVQALHGVAEVEKAHRSLFVTTSAYMPAARKFADRTSGRMELATSEDIVRWCSEATDGIIRDKSKLVTPDEILKIIGRLSGRADPRILRASVGFNMIINAYALVLKETSHAALLLKLPQVIVDDDGYGQIGHDRPNIDYANIPILNAETVWRSKRRIDSNGLVSYWDGRHFWTSWDGQKQYFSYVD